MTAVLLDTGAVVALLDRSEKYHEAVVDCVSEQRLPLATTEAVITESCYLLRKLAGAPEAVLANVESRRFSIPFPLHSYAKRASELLTQYRDRPMDFADASLVCLAEKLRAGVVLTLDRDFEFYRWQGSKRFELPILLKN